MVPADAQKRTLSAGVAKFSCSLRFFCLTKNHLADKFGSHVPLEMFGLELSLKWQSSLLKQK
jgi:hypothetical protein